MAKNSVNGGTGNRSKTQERKRSKKRIKSRKNIRFVIFLSVFFWLFGEKSVPLQ